MTPKITSIGDNAFYGCSNLKFFVVPESVVNAANLGANMFNGSSVENVVFLGLTLSQVQQRIISTQFFGLRKNCKFQVKSDVKMYQYTSSTNSISEIDKDTTQYGQRTLTQAQIDYTPTAGRHAKFSVNKLYKYDENLVDKFIGSDKPAVPMIVFYIDSSTSQKSREFIDDVLRNSTIGKVVGDTKLTPNGFYMVLDRANASADQLKNFRTNFASQTQVTSFPCVVMRYRDQKKISSFRALFQ